MMKNKKKVPDIRFKGFNEPWIKGSFGEFGYVSMNRRIFKDQTSPTEEIPFYKIGTFGGEPDSYISRKLFEEYKRKYPYPQIGDILISASGSIGRLVEYSGEEEYFQDSNIVWLAHDGRLSNSFLKHLYSIIKWNGLEGSTIKRLYNKNILDTTFMIPNSECESKSIEEQQAIGNYFQNIDRLINTSQTKLDKLKNIKKACLEKMFPRNGSTTPELRFKGFTEEWKHIYLKEIGNWDKGFGLPKADLDKEGLYPCIHYGELFAYSEIIKSIASYTNIKSDKTTSNNDILFPDSDVTPDGLGRCSAIEIPNVILGGGINVLKLYKDFRAPYISLNVNNNRKQIIERVTGTTVRHIHSKDLNDIELFVSKNLIEQQKIGDCFEKLDVLITKTEQQINKLKNIKKACLDKMFVNTEG